MATLRSFRASDADACMAVIRSNLPEFFDASEIADYEAFVAAPEGPYFVVEDDALGVGACGGYVVDAAAGVATLAWGMVHRSRHRQGLGTLLLRHRLARIAAEGVAREILLDTSRRSAPFFERFGFETQSVTPEGYGPGLDRHDMRLAIANLAV